MRRVLVLALVAALLAPGLAVAKDGDLEDRGRSTNTAALNEIRGKNPRRALAMVEPVIADFERAYAGKGRMYCAATEDEAASYAIAPKSNGGVGDPAGETTAPTSSRVTVMVDSPWCTAQYIRAFALVDLQRMDEAQAGFERLLQFAPQRSRYLNELGYIYQQKRQWQRSIDIYKRADAGADLLDAAGRDYERCIALRGIGYNLVELGALDDAEASYRRCLAITPGEPKSLDEIEYIKQQRRKAT